MKLTKLLSSLTLLFTISSAFAGDVYNCKQNPEFSPVNPAKGALSVRVEVLRDVTNLVSWGKDFDYVYKVKVDAKRTLKGKTSIVKSFTSYANSVDVIFEVAAQKKYGTSMTIYLDELDQSSITMDNVRTSLDCSFEE